jgi:hypothetical protein
MVVYYTEYIAYQIYSNMLDYSIRGPLTPSISPRFYGSTGRGGATGMVSELKS